MAATEGVPSFDDIIQADRLRRKHEALAKEIFGKGRKASPPGGAAKHKSGTGPSLASRVGVTKPIRRSASSTPKLRANLEKSWVHDLHPHDDQLLGVARPPQAVSKSSKHPPAAPALGATLRKSPTRAPFQREGTGMTIRGLAGPYTVIGSNFAPGTTSADIESAMTPLGGEMQSCQILTSSPTVIAEMVFTDKGGAENVIATFNNQKADGRILKVYMKAGPSTFVPKPTPSLPLFKAAAPRTIPTEPSVDRSHVTRLEEAYNGANLERNGRRAAPEIQDGSYGFESKNDRMDYDMEVSWDDRRDSRQDRPRDSGRGRDGGQDRNGRGLYSDQIYSRQRGRDYR